MIDIVPIDTAALITAIGGVIAAIGAVIQQRQQNRRVREDVQEVRSEVTRNGGGSLKDAAVKSAELSADAIQQISSLSAQVDMVAQQNTHTNRSVEQVAEQTSLVHRALLAHLTDAARVIERHDRELTELRNGGLPPHANGR